MAKVPTKRDLELLEIKPVDNPHDEGATLLKTLELQGALRVHSDTQMAMARRMYVKGDMSPRDISKKVAVPADIIRRWILNFSWDEAKAEYELKKYQQVCAIAKKYSVDVDRRADRLLHSAEGIVEEMLARHSMAMDKLDDWYQDVEDARLHDEEPPPKPEGLLSPKDLASLVGTIKTTHNQRRLARGIADVKASDSAARVHIEGNVEIQQHIMNALADHAGHTNRISAEVKRPVEMIEDAEYDSLD